MISFWERESFVHYDFIVIGAGIVGLSTALSIREKSPNASIAIVEKGMFPTGASTKNAGFACFGSLTELLADIRAVGDIPTQELVQTRINGLKKLRKRIGDVNLDYQQNGGYELITKNELGALQEMESVNSLIQPVIHDHTFQLRPELVSEFGFDKSSIETIIFNPHEGQLDTGKMMKNLTLLATENNIAIYTGTEVTHLEEGETVTVKVSSNHIDNSLKAGRVIVCTNAFTHKLFPDQDITPGRGLVLITKPIEALKFKGAFHMDEGYYYFRDFQNRLLFGGGRNEFVLQEQTTDFAINEKILKLLKNKLSNVILPDTDYTIDMAWTGIMAFGPSKQPILKWYSDKILLGVRLGGMGVAIGSELGEELARMVTTDAV
ncbi:MAG: FAD-dependent oxidoreductase [Bacteroidota bacterium]